MIKILKATHYNGKTYCVNEEYEIDDITAVRWIKNGIAEQSDNNLFDETRIRKNRNKAEKTEQAEQGTE